MKKIIGLIVFCLVVIGALQLVDIYKESQLTESEKELQAFFEDEGHVITILMPDNYYLYNWQLYNDVLAIGNTIIMKEFDYDDKVKVEVIRLNVNSREELMREKNLLLSSENGPTLIMVDLGYNSMDELIDYGIAMKIDDQLENYKNVYDFLKDDYYVPLGLSASGTIVNTDTLEEMGEEVPNADWTREDFYHIQEKWFEDHDVYINYYEFQRLYNYYFADVELMDITGKVDLNNAQTVDKIMAVRDEFISNNYKIEPRMSMNTLQKMVRLDTNDAWWWNERIRVENEVNHFVINDNVNALHPFSTYHPLLYRPLKLLPRVHEGNSTITDMGFIVNVNGVNSEYGLKFLDHIISDDYQFYIYEKKMLDVLAPSISTIEDRILNKHPRKVGDVEKKVAPFAFETRAQIIADLESGKITPNRKSRQVLILERNFRQFVIEIAFNDIFFSRKQIEDKLKKLEREVYLKMNE